MVNNHAVANWDKKNILNADDINEARDLFKTVKLKEYHQYYNLFDVKRCDLPSKGNYGFVNRISETLGVSELIGSPYFLLYETNSFTREHEDNETGTTVVTLIESSTDLVGGEALIFDMYGVRPRPSHKEERRTKRERANPPYSKNIIPRIVPMEQGDSLIYGPDLRHGVTQVEQGTRLVLITWWRDKCLN